MILSNRFQNMWTFCAFNFFFIFITLFEIFVLAFLNCNGNFLHIYKNPAGSALVLADASLLRSLQPPPSVTVTGFIMW